MIPALAILCAVGAAAPAPEWRLSLSPADKTLMLRLARAELASKPFEPGSVNLRFVTGLDLFVSLYGEGGRRLRAGSPSGSLEEQIRACTKELRKHPDLPKLGDYRIKIDIVRSRIRLFHPSELVFWKSFSPGETGIKLPGDEPLCLLPSVTIEEQLATPEAVIERLLEGSRQGNRDLPLELFRTISFIERYPGGAPLELYRAFPLVRRITRKDLRAAYLAGAEWFLRNQRPDGSFNYLYYPLDDSYEDKEDSLARQTGVAYALYRIYRQTGKHAFYEAGERSLAFLLRQKREKGGIAFLATSRKGELGPTSLLILALVERRKATSSKQYDALLGKLGRFACFMMKQSGEFYTNYFFEEDGFEPAENPSDIPTGQAVLALVRLRGELGDKAWLPAAEKAARFLITERPRKLLRAGLDDPILADAWLAQALRELYTASPNYLYAEHAFTIGSRILESQLRGECEPDFVGGFLTQPPSVCTSASRAEGLVAIGKLAKQMGIPSELYEDALLNAARFLIANQFNRENAYFLPNPDRAIGAFRKDATDLSVRIDYTRHAVVFLVELEELLYGHPEETAAR